VFSIIKEQNYGKPALYCFRQVGYNNDSVVVATINEKSKISIHAQCA
jgi:hypothetical protein